MNQFVHLPCPSCGTMNRTRVEKLGARPVCAKCKARLALGRVLPVSTAQFPKVVMESGLPALVFFWANWCGVCRSVAPLIEQVARQNAASVLVASLDTGLYPELANRYNIMGVPTLIMFRDGREINRQVGGVPLTTIEAMVRLSMS